MTLENVYNIEMFAINKNTVDFIIMHTYNKSNL